MVYGSIKKKLYRWVGLKPYVEEGTAMLIISWLYWSVRSWAHQKMSLETVRYCQKTKANNHRCPTFLPRMSLSNLAKHPNTKAIKLQFRAFPQSNLGSWATAESLPLLSKTIQGLLQRNIKNRPASPRTINSRDSMIQSSPRAKPICKTKATAL